MGGQINPQSLSVRMRLPVCTFYPSGIIHIFDHQSNEEEYERIIIIIIIIIFF